MNKCFPLLEGLYGCYVTETVLTSETFSLLTGEGRVCQELLDVVVGGDALVRQGDAAGETPRGSVQRGEDQELLLGLRLHVPGAALVFLRTWTFASQQQRRPRPQRHEHCGRLPSHGVAAPFKYHTHTHTSP